MATTSTETDKRRGRIRIEPGTKRVRAYLDGEVVADSARPVLVWEVPYYPTYYFPTSRSPMCAPSYSTPTAASRTPPAAEMRAYSAYGPVRTTRPAPRSDTRTRRSKSCAT